MHMEKYVEDFCIPLSNVDIKFTGAYQKERVHMPKNRLRETFKRYFLYILVGVGIGAIIHNWIPESWIENRLWEANNPWVLY